MIKFEKTETWGFEHAIRGMRNPMNMLEYRRGHKLDEWRQFCDWILTLPHGSLLKEGVGNEQ